MKQMITGPSVPTAGICINKSRLKVYNKEQVPTYYLQKGQEFQIELFNPTSDTILAKIHLNGKPISQGGLVLRPGERVFLERYLNIAKKFLFDTYEVAKTAEAQRAIEDNGDFKVEFFRESNPIYTYTTLVDNFPPNVKYFNTTGGGYVNLTTTGGGGYVNLTTGDGGSYTTNISNNSGQIGGALTSLNATPSNVLYTSNQIIRKEINAAPLIEKTPDYYKKKEAALAFEKRRRAKIGETGRVEAGSQSNQRIDKINKSFEYFPFHSIEYKMLPVSQKINTAQDVNVKRYCHNCGAKQKPEFKFCPSCGAKC